MPRLKPLDPERDVDLKRLCAVFDEVGISDDLRRKTDADVMRALHGEIKPVTVYRNLTRRLGVAGQESGPL